jgi:hypothetical protein
MACAEAGAADEDATPVGFIPPGTVAGGADVADGAASLVDAVRGSNALYGVDPYTGGLDGADVALAVATGDVADWGGAIAEFVVDAAAGVRGESVRAASCS